MQFAPRSEVFHAQIFLCIILWLLPSLFTAYSAAQDPPAAQTPQPKRPMTFEDMMQMKRLGDTAVSPDGKWLAYSVTTVDLAQNTKTAELWLQAIARPDTSSEPIQAGGWAAG